MRKKFTKKKGGSGRGLSLTAKRTMSKSKASIRKRTIFERNIPMDIFIKEEDLAVEKSKFSDNVKEPFKNQYNLFFIYDQSSKEKLYFILPIQFLLNDLYFHSIAKKKICYKFKNIGIEILSQSSPDRTIFYVKFKSEKEDFPGEYKLYYHKIKPGSTLKHVKHVNDLFFLEIALNKKSVFNTQSNNKRQSGTVQILKLNDKIKTFNKIKDYCKLKMDFYYNKYYFINKLIERIDYLIEIYNEAFPEVKPHPVIPADIEKYLNTSSIPEKLLTEENFDDLKPFPNIVEIYEEYKGKIEKIQIGIDNSYHQTQEFNNNLLENLEAIIKKKEELQKQSRNIGTFQRDKRTSAHFWCNKPHHYIPENFEEYTDNFGYTEGDCQANKFFICSLPPVKELTSLPEATVIKPASTSQKKSRGKSLRKSLRSFFGSKKKSLLNSVDEFSA